ncbi:MAG: hypothetical protein CMP22_07275 [Rickettsiales bacterium]|nr:hypothetical protein [Rickettsiales bacterium]|tara:strand:- start:607 stop:960 length:354 start_codon:yes stop_codon:yes gene_type:complete
MSKSKSNTHYSIVARPQGGFRRAGFVFKSNQPTVLKKDDLTKEQIEAITSEPNLVVVETGGAPAGNVTAEADLAALKAEKEQVQKDLDKANAALETTKKALDKANAEIEQLKPKSSK